MTFVQNLIDWWLRNIRRKYFTHIQNDNKFENIWKSYKKGRKYDNDRAKTMSDF